MGSSSMEQMVLAIFISKGVVYFSFRCMKAMTARAKSWLLRRESNCQRSYLERKEQCEWPAT